jgi:hypothetical protein
MMVCGMLSSWLHYRMSDEVNLNLPKEQRIPAFAAAGPFTFARVRKLHRAMYPRSNLPFAIDCLVALGGVSAAVLAYAVGIFG